MEIKLRRSLYIGLGGTGINAILHTKKLFMETYGEVPPMIGFLGIDTDKAAFQKTIEANVSGSIEKVGLEKSESGTIMSFNPIPVYEKDKDGLFSWMHEKTNARYIKALVNGAGQIRTNGRLGLMLNSDNIRNSIQGAITRISAHIRDTKYGFPDDGIDVHIVFSIAGGTGSGTFIDVAYLVRQAAGELNGKSAATVKGYAMLPEVFKLMRPHGNAMANVYANGYSAIMDVDYLMHLDNTASKPVAFRFSDANTLETKDVPYNSIMLIDNKNAGGIIYTSVDQLTEMLSIPLFISAGALGNSTLSVLDNIESQKTSARVGNKNAWAFALGASEIVFNSQMVADVYAMRATKLLILKLLANELDSEGLSNAWIESVKIREHERNDLIDQICSEKPKSDVDDIDSKNVERDINDYYSSTIPDNKFFTEKENTIRENVLLKLDEFIKDRFRETNSPIISTLAALNNIVQEVTLYRSEMISELSQHEKEAPQLEAKLKSAIKDLKDASGIFSGKKRKEALDEIQDCVRKITVNKIESKRKLSAQNIFDALLNKLRQETDRIIGIETTLNSIARIVGEEITKVQNYVEARPNLFEVDLSGDFITSNDFKVSSEDIKAEEFISYVLNDKQGKIDDKIWLYDVLSKQTDLKAKLLAFTKELPEAIGYAEMSVDERLAKMSNNDFSHLLDNALSKCQVLLNINGGAYAGKINNRDKAFCIGVYNHGNSQIETKRESDNSKETIFESKLVQSDKKEFVSTGMKDRVVFYRLEGPVPPFVSTVIMGSGKNDYDDFMDNKNMTPNFDANLLKQMIRDDHALLPSATGINAAMKYWVMGFILGYVRRKKGVGTYQYCTDLEHIGSDRAWASLDSKVRNDAYANFRRQIENVSRLYENYLTDIIKRDFQGMSVKVTTAIVPIDGMAGYFDEYADSGVNRVTLTDNAHRDLYDQIIAEIDFVEKNLEKTVEQYVNK